MEFDVKTILILLNGLLLPCFLWVWRISTTQRLQQIRLDTLQGDLGKKAGDLSDRIAQMPTHKTIHGIEKTLIKIEGSLNVIGTEINHIKENNRSFEEALNHLDNRTHKVANND